MQFIETQRDSKNLLRISNLICMNFDSNALFTIPKIKNKEVNGSL